MSNFRVVWVCFKHTSVCAIIWFYNLFCLYLHFGDFSMLVYLAILFLLTEAWKASAGRCALKLIIKINL